VLKGGNGLLLLCISYWIYVITIKTGQEDDMDLGASGISVLFKTQKKISKTKN
jgi:hypothetical protein